MARAGRLQGPGALEEGDLEVPDLHGQAVAAARGRARPRARARGAPTRQTARMRVPSLSPVSSRARPSWSPPADPRAARAAPRSPRPSPRAPPARRPARRGAATPPASAARPLGDWPLFGLRPSRENATNRATGITARSVARLRRVRVALPGTVDSSPIVLRGVRVRGAARDVAFATTTYGKTVAVDLAPPPPPVDLHAGRLRPRRRAPRRSPTRARPPTRPRASCTRRRPTAWSTSCASRDGREAGGAWPVRVTRDPTHEKLTSSFNVSGSRLIVATGGYIGDAPPYQGHVVSIDRATGTIAAVFNSLCSDRREIIQPSSCAASDSAIWARSGAVVLPGSGDLLVATGNAPFDGRTDWGDSRAAARPGHARLTQNWTPANQEQLEATDADLGSTAPAVLGGGLLLQGGKDAKLDLLDAGKLNGAGGASARKGGQLQTLPRRAASRSSPPRRSGTTAGARSSSSTTDGATQAYRLRGPPPARGCGPTTTRARARCSPAACSTSTTRPAAGCAPTRPSTGRVVATLPAGAGHWGSPVVDRRAHRAAGGRRERPPDERRAGRVRAALGFEGDARPDALEPADVLRALRAGVATLDALRARLGGAERDQLAWALDDLAARGLVQVSGRRGTAGPDGLCGTSAPATAVLTDAGRAALRG